MRKYVFMYDDELICTRIIDGQEKTFYGEKAISLLVKKDKINFKNVRIHNNRIVMQSNKTQVIIRDLEEMYENGMFDYFYHNISKINKAYNKSTKKGLTKGKVAGIATVGIIVAIVLAITAGKIKDRSSEVIPIEIEQEEDLEEYDNVVQNILSEPINDMAMQVSTSANVQENNEIKTPETTVTDPNELLNELDEIDEEQALEEYLNSAEVFSLAYDTEYDQVKYDYAYENFKDYLVERPPRWGVDPLLAQGMLTQETGGYQKNLMQIQFNSWHDQEITSFNYETGKMETIILTNNPDGYVRKPDTQYITEKDLENPKTNISVACIILQYSFDQMERNLPAAIQCFNFGTGNMDKVMEETSLNTGLSVDEILADPTNTDWLPYREIIDVGDKNYLEHVLRYIPNQEEGIWINYIDENGDIQQSSITFYNENARKDL